MRQKLVLPDDGDLTTLAYTKQDALKHYESIRDKARNTYDKQAISYEQEFKSIQNQAMKILEEKRDVAKQVMKQTCARAWKEYCDFVNGLP